MWEDGGGDGGGNEALFLQVVIWMVVLVCMVENVE